ncbi:MAG: replicative DNA helicase [Acidithiobacillales bacterium SG8_45]|jgi:replicative DNA helicase|nr:MAG: replicative DNA helicase [Acidithiobacillales bacterium SG8_45]
MEEHTHPADFSRSRSLEARLPPQSVEAEQSVIGGLLIDNSRWDQVADVVAAADFYRKEHRLIFDAIVHLAQENSPADVVTVSEYLESQHELDSVGGLSYLGSLANNTPSAANIVAYAKIVRERAVMRQLVTAVGKISDSVYTPEGRNATELLDHAEQTIMDISEKGAHRKGGFQPLKSLLAGAVDRIDMLFHSDSALTGISSGFKDLDEMTSGLQASDLVVLAGRPSMGKTSLAINMAENAAVGEQKHVAIFSMEMPGEQLAMRMLSSLGRINGHKVRTGKLDDDDWPRLMSAMTMLSEAPIYIDDTPGLSPMELRARARRLKREHGLDLIIIDYLQLMQSGESSENRATEISAITRAMKNLAKELSVPVIAMSQLNRSLEQRTDKRPIMSDLRESGAIEQDADVILFIYRDEVYHEDSQDKGTAEIIIGKQRNGPTGTIRLTFLGEYTKFENYIHAGFDEAYA